MLSSPTEDLVRGYLMTWLAKASQGQTLDEFIKTWPEDWLVWEAGPWRPTYQTKETLAQGGLVTTVPHGSGESLAIALETPKQLPYLSLGRASDNDIVVDDATLSRVHLLLQPEPLGWSARDAGSTNGSTVEGAPLGPDAVALQTGMRMQAGSVRFTYYDAGGLCLRLRGKG
jgi:pSer/pThr/pTyr-binding forkhead associated (FHA) protein